MSSSSHILYCCSRTSAPLHQAPSTLTAPPLARGAIQSRPALTPPQTLSAPPQNRARCHRAVPGISSTSPSVVCSSSRSAASASYATNGSQILTACVNKVKRLCVRPAIYQLPSHTQIRKSEVRRGRSFAFSLHATETITNRPGTCDQPCITEPCMDYIYLQVNSVYSPQYVPTHITLHTRYQQCKTTQRMGAVQHVLEALSLWS